MELRELRAFIAVVEAGGLSAAARKLHLSQPALSQTIRRLERDLAVPLLVRSSTGVTPTDAGRVLLDEARAVLLRADQLVNRLTGASDDGGRVLRLGLPLELPPGLLPPALAVMRAEWPHVRVQAHHANTADQLAALSAGDLDVALVRELPAGQVLDTELLLAEPLGVLLAAEHVAAGTTVRLEELAGLPWLSFARQDSPAWWDEISAVLRRHGHNPPSDPNSSPLIADVKFAGVAGGAAFAFAPADWSQPLPQEIVWQPLSGAPLVRRTWAAWPAVSRRRDIAALVRALQDQLVP